MKELKLVYNPFLENVYPWKNKAYFTKKAARHGFSVDPIPLEEGYLEKALATCTTNTAAIVIAGGGWEPALGGKPSHKRRP